MGKSREIRVGISISIQNATADLLKIIEKHLAEGYKRIKVKIKPGKDVALELGSCRVINIKIGRVGGLSEAKKIHDLCREHNVPVWCGGMLESGVGRAHNIALTTSDNFTIP